MAISPIKIIIGGIDQFSTKFAKISGNIERAGAKMKSVGQMATVGLTLPIAAMGISTVMTAAQFEKSMNRVAVLSRATDSQFSELSKTARKLGAETVFSGNQAADAMGYLAASGMDVDKVIAAMPGTLALAAASQMEIAATADIAASVLTGFGMEATRMTEVADVLALTMSTANANVEQLGEAIKFVGPVAGAMGVSIQETAAALGLLGNAGIKGAMAGTNLRMILAQLANPTKEAIETMSGLGIQKDQIVDSQGNVKGFISVIKALGESGATTADIMKIFGSRVGPAVLALVKQGGDKLAAYTRQLEGAGGTAERISKRQLKGFYGELELLTSAFEEFQMVIADSGLLSWVTQIVTVLTKVMDGMTKTNPEFLRFLVIVAGLVAIGGPLLLVLGQVALSLTSILALFKSVAVIVGVSTKAVAIFAGTAMLVVAALAIWAYNIYLIWKNWEAITSAFSSWRTFWETMKFFFADIFESLKGIARIALPKWLERKIGLTPAASGNISADEALNRSAAGGGVTETKSTVKVNFSNLPAGTDVYSDDADVDIDEATGAILAGG